MDASCMWPLHEGPDLIGSNQVHHDENIGHVYQPVGVEETKPSQQVAWGTVAKGSIAHHSNSQVECGGHYGCNGGAPLHLGSL